MRFVRNAVATFVAAVAALFVAELAIPTAAGCTASDPCGAKSRYEAASKREAALNAQVLKSTPRGATPAGDQAEWRKMVATIRSSKEYLSVEEFQRKVKQLNELIAATSSDRDRLEHGIVTEKEKIAYHEARIRELEAGNLTAAGRAQLVQHRNDLAEAKRELDRQEDELSRSSARLTAFLSEKDKLKDLVRAALLADSLEQWIKYRDLQDEWSKADDEKEAAKKGYDAALLEKQHAMQEAQKAYDDAVRQLQEANRELSGRPRDEAYMERVKALVVALRQKLAYSKQWLNGLDCFPDAKALAEKMTRQQAALQNIKFGTAPAKAPNHPNPPKKPASTTASAGVFKLTNKEVGHVPGPDAGPYGTWSGSIGENSFDATYKTTSAYEFNADLHASWSTPPATLKPGDTVELFVVTSGSVTGKDRGSVGLSAGWEVSGSVEVISKSGAFSGIAGNGQEYGSGKGSIKFKVGSSGTITISSYRGGVSWGSGGNFTPCTYTYTFVK